MHQIYLSRRNLQTLLNKLDRAKIGGGGHCTIIKHQHPDNPAVYMQTMRSMVVTAVEEIAEDVEVHAVEDRDFYAHREAGEMNPLDVPQP